MNKSEAEPSPESFL